MYSYAPNSGENVELNRCTLRFINDPRMEALFRQFYAQKSVLCVRIACIVCVVLFVIFSIIGNIPPSSKNSTVNYVVPATLCGFMVVTFAISFTKTLYARIHNVLVTLACLVFIGGLISINIIGWKGYTSHEIIPILIVTFVSHNFLCLNFVYSTSLFCILQVSYCTILPQFYGIQTEYIISSIFLFTSNVLTSTSNYNMERYLRREFTQRYLLGHDKELISKVETANQMKALFLANVTHELRTPIHGIWGNAQLLTDSSMSEMQQHHVKNISDCTQILLALINNLLDMSKIDAGKMALGICALNPRDIMEEAMEAVAASALVKKVKISSFTSFQVPEEVEGDPNKLRQILVNVIGNAVKFTDQGEVHAHVSVVSETESECEISFRVKDTGIGIKDADIPLLFQRFQQLDDGPTKKFQGSGIGLALAHELVSLMGGELTVSSKIGSGSVFQVNLRFAKFPGVPIPMEETADSSSQGSEELVGNDTPRTKDRSPTCESLLTPTRDASSMVSLNVLVVDPSENVRNTMCNYMHEASPFHCACAQDRSTCVELCGIGVGRVSEALRVLSTRKFSIVIINDWFADECCLELLKQLDERSISIVYAYHSRLPTLPEGLRIFPLQLPFRCSELLRCLYTTTQAILFGDVCFPDNESMYSTSYLAGSSSSIATASFGSKSRHHADRALMYSRCEEDSPCSIQIDPPSTETPPKNPLNITSRLQRTLNNFVHLTDTASQQIQKSHQRSHSYTSSSDANSKQNPSNISWESNFSSSTTNFSPSQLDVSRRRSTPRPLSRSSSAFSSMSSMFTASDLTNTDYHNNYIEDASIWKIGNPPPNPNRSSRPPLPILTCHTPSPCPSPGPSPATSPRISRFLASSPRAMAGRSASPILIFPPRLSSSSTELSKGNLPETPSFSAKILLCEDNAVSQMTTRRMLEKTGFVCHVADNGLQGVEASAKIEYDVILMDVFMPVCDGYAATKMIREREAKQNNKRRIPIICLTANMQDGEKEKCLACGMDDYLTKPCRQEDLVNVVLKWRPKMWSSG